MVSSAATRLEKDNPRSPSDFAHPSTPAQATEVYSPGYVRDKPSVIQLIEHICTVRFRCSSKSSSSVHPHVYPREDVPSDPRSYTDHCR